MMTASYLAQYFESLKVNGTPCVKELHVKNKMGLSCNKIQVIMGRRGEKGPVDVPGIFT